MSEYYHYQLVTDLLLLTIVINKVSTTASILTVLACTCYDGSLIKLYRLVRSPPHCLMGSSYFTSTSMTSVPGNSWQDLETRNFTYNVDLGLNNTHIASRTMSNLSGITAKFLKLWTDKREQKN